MIEPHTGLSLRVLAELKIDDPVVVPNLPHLMIVATKNVDKYKNHNDVGYAIELSQIPDRFFIIYKKD
jgi:hypothetical protein